MATVNICIDTIDKVKRFVNALANLDGNFDLVSERYVVDAKSIMGIFSLDLEKPLKLNISDTANTDEVVKSLKEFIID